MLLNEALTILKKEKHDILYNRITDLPKETISQEDYNLVQAINTIIDKVDTHIMKYDELIKECENIKDDTTIPEDKKLNEVIEKLKVLASQKIIIANY